MKPNDIYDLVIIGGGINGTGIARDAAGRGLKVLLAERHDLGSATSSASTKLIHGGLRYLEYCEFRLVSEALAERETLLSIAPHIVWPLEFVLPHDSHLRPAWMIRAGLFLYDHLGGRVFPFGTGVGPGSLPKSRGVKLAADGYGAGLRPGLEKGFVYYDCWVDDARLVALNARSAAQHGATILTRTRCTGARRENGTWTVSLEAAAGRADAARTVVARALVNATGPWVKSVIERELQLASPGKVRLVKGSHIVVPRIHDRRHAYLLQNPDRRFVFLIPYEREFTLIGTTDVPVSEGEGGSEISSAEAAYLCEAASRYTGSALTPDEVVWSYSGVRPLYDDGSADVSAVTRDYHLMLDADSEGQGGNAPLVSVFGGKITTYRRLAEQVLDRLSPWLACGRPWTHTEPLPGGDFGDTDFDGLLADYKRRYPDLLVHWMARLLRRHGVLAAAILAGARTETDLGENFGGGLYEAELRYLIANEWAREPADVLWRRTKCGLHMNAAQRERVAQFMRDADRTGKVA